MADALATIRDYHERTQHHLQRYARALGYLDWATQPDPFRRYVGAERVELPLRPPTGAPRYAELFTASLPTAPVTAATIGQLFQDSLALTAQKEHQGHRWFLRANPSSGNLHPTEAYLLAPPAAGLGDAAALWHYAPDAHALERRRELPPAVWQALTAGLPDGALLVGLSSIAWREAWKYGERALRYCMQDLGHALGALGFAAAALGWRTALLPVTDDALATLLAIDDQRGPERESPDALLVVDPSATAQVTERARAWSLAERTVVAMRALPRQGQPAVLSQDHHDWPAIDAAIAASRCTALPDAAWWDGSAASGAASRPAPLPVPAACARTLFAQRRSAVAMDGRTGLAAEQFLATMQRAADPAIPPFALLPWRSRVHLLLFVHRVDGLPPGLYCLARGGQQPSWLQQRLRAEFLWQRAPGAPEDLPLFLLLPIDCRQAAQTVSCHQEIAADSAYAAAMLSEFEPTLAAFGAFGWRCLHWEAGALGQLLYLEAEAQRRRATGIGCFFDSAVHELLGSRSGDLRTIYHFTAGGAVDDPRLRTSDPYAGRPARLLR